jgi:phage major head subunit gpT-like protein
MAGASPANTKSYPLQLDRDINEMFQDEYLGYPSQFDKIAHVQKAPAGGHITKAEISSLGLPVVIPEGGSMVFDFPIEGNKLTFYWKKYGLGFQATEEDIRYERFGKIKGMAASLGRSMAYEREVIFWDLLNSGFATHAAWDANYLFTASGRYTLKSHTAMNNRPAVDASLSETTLQAALEYGENAVNSSGEPITLTPWMLVTTTKNNRVAKVLLETDKKVGSNDNDKNIMNGVLDLFVCRHLTYSGSNYPWFVLYKEHDLNFWWEMPITDMKSSDFNTGNVLWQSKMIFGVGCFNPIGMYGTTG